MILELSGSTAAGQGVSTDIIEAAALAYVRALSNVERKVADGGRGARGLGAARAHRNALNMTRGSRSSVVCSRTASAARNAGAAQQLAASVARANEARCGASRGRCGRGRSSRSAKTYSVTVQVSDGSGS